MKTFYCTFSSLRKATRTKSPPKPQNKSTPLRTRTRVNRELSDSDSDLSLTDDGLYSTPIEAKIEVRRYVGKTLPGQHDRYQLLSVTIIRVDTVEPG